MSHPLRLPLSSSCLTLLLCLGLTGAQPALAAKTKASKSSKSAKSTPSATGTARITLTQGDQHTFAVQGEVVRVATADEKIAGINAVPPSGVVVTGTAPGTVMVSVWVEGRNTPVSQALVTVQPRLSGSREALGSEGTQLKIDMLGPGARLSGATNSLEGHQAAMNNASAAMGGGQSGKKLVDDDGKGGGDKTPVVDGTTSNFDVQVQLDVKVVEVSRSKLKSSGFNATRFSGSATTGLAGPSGLSGFVSDATNGRTIESGTGFVPRADAFNIFRWGSNSLTVFSALESNGFAYTLAEPSLTAISGRTATFLAGGELPIPLRTGSGSDSTIRIEYKKFGVQLAMTPTVLDGNRMAIHLAPEVSEIDDSLSVTAGGLSVPGLRVRRTETTVALGDGETFVISGLVNQQTAATVDKFPILGDIPILGLFFKSNRFSRDDRELLMIVTPHLVRPFAKDAKLPALPGEALKDYDPGYLRFLFLESGKFRQPDAGFSR